MLKRKKRWAVACSYGYCGVMIYHFMNGKRAMPKVIHFITYLMIHSNLHHIGGALGIMFNLQCSRS